MTTDVKVLIAEFLRTHKRLVVPQLGAFIVKAPGGGDPLFGAVQARRRGAARAFDGRRRQRDRSGGRHRPADFRSAPRRAARRRVSRRGAGVFSAGANGTLTFAYDPQAGAAAGPASALPAGSAVETEASGEPAADDRCIRHGRIGRVGCRRPRTDAAL